MKLIFCPIGDATSRSHCGIYLRQASRYINDFSSRCQDTYLHSQLYDYETDQLCRKRPRDAPCTALPGTVRLSAIQDATTVARQARPSLYALPSHYLRAASRQRPSSQLNTLPYDGVAGYMNCQGGSKGEKPSKLHPQKPDRKRFPYQGCLVPGQKQSLLRWRRATGKADSFDCTELPDIPFSFLPCQTSDRVSLRCGTISSDRLELQR